MLVSIGSLSLTASVVFLLPAVVILSALLLREPNHERQQQGKAGLILRCGPGVLFFLSLLLPWASAQGLAPFGYSGQNGYSILFPGILSLAKWTDTGYLAIISLGDPLGPSGPSPYIWFIFLSWLLWYSFCEFIYLEIRNAESDYNTKFFLLIIAGLMESLLMVAVAIVWPLDVLYWTGPISMVASFLWYWISHRKDIHLLSNVMELIDEAVYPRS
jgi:hypothetical protein